MTKPARGSLANMAPPKAGAVPPAAPVPEGAPPAPAEASSRTRAPVPRRSQGDMKTVQVRINRDGWKALRDLAADSDSSLEALMVEALNDVLLKNRRPPIVQRRTGERGTETDD